ncbi:MAG: hypothetical protein HY306_05305 [Nitrosomonadales bacterium]|nr:hypothetical protein [Nitrosomonadales bacterium]
MPTPPLQPIDPSANPAFKDASTCARWLGQLQLTNLHQAHGVLRTQLGEFNRYPVSGLERLHALELLRETVASVQVDYAKKLVAKKLPLSEDELAILVALIDLWKNMVTGYRRCLQACMDGERQLTPYEALLCQRCLLYSGAQIFEYLRNGYEFNGNLWRQLHALYAHCEQRNLRSQEISDDLGDARTTTCTATYARILLACHAYRSELPRQQLRLLDRWLAQWDGLLSIECQGVASMGDAPPLAINLDSEQGIQPPYMAHPSDTLRYLPTMPLSKQLRVKIVLLQQGQSPQKLGLGDGCNNADCLSLLNHLHQCWCEGHDIRQIERLNTVQQAQVCYGMESCFAYIANKPFKQPSTSIGMDTLSRKQIATFGRTLSDTSRHDLSVMGFVLETWLIEDESIRGARLLREENEGVRLGPGQLTAVRPTNANAFMLGTIIWGKVTQARQLHIGVRYFPGLPQSVAMKATGINLTISDKYVAALLLPAVPMLNIPPSLITPRDWFKPGRVVEIIQVDKKRVFMKMELSVEKGSDYERIGYIEIPGNPA